MFADSLILYYQRFRNRHIHSFNLIVWCFLLTVAGMADSQLVIRSCKLDLRVRNGDVCFFLVKTRPTHCVSTIQWIKWDWDL